ncbi:MAG: UDP-N-acetylmuramate dehydrogenase [Anaerolineae bacterium]|nr:UDP-N-acetylmuramate dehydrogenase [Anaerolineae bacterium]
MASPAALGTLAQALKEALVVQAPLAPHAMVGVGGPSDGLIVVHSRESLIEALRLTWETGVPWRVFGGLTNVLLPDSGLRGVVILNQAREVQFNNDCLVWAASGALIVKVAREAVRQGWGGLTWAVGLPGTVGGAIVNNAGAFGGEISRTLTFAEVLEPGKDPQQVGPDWFDFTYRCSRLKGVGQQAVVLSATFHLTARDLEELSRKATEYSERRLRTQPPGKTLGSTFKNPPGDYAGRLIEAAGLKGMRCGGFVVSMQHANFLMNDAGGTAVEFRTLVRLIQDRVQEQFGIWLEPEIEILPEA